MQIMNPSRPVMLTTLLCAGLGNAFTAAQIDLKRDMPLVITVAPPAATTAGTLQSDTISGQYSNDEGRVACLAGRTASMVMKTDKNAQRTLTLQLGPELDPLPGDGNDRIQAPNTPKLDFFAANNLPDPSGTITEVRAGIAYFENIAMLGAQAVLPGDRPPNYCDANWQEIPDALVDPNDPETFSRACSNMRITFKSGRHEWRLYFGAPTRRTSAGFAFSHPDAGEVRVQRILPSRDPFDVTVPWLIEAQPWKTTDVDHPRYGRIVGFLYYRGTTGGDPMLYAGAFHVRWAEPGAPWEARPL